MLRDNSSHLGRFLKKKERFSVPKLARPTFHLVVIILGTPAYRDPAHLCVPHIQGAFSSVSPVVKKGVSPWRTRSRSFSAREKEERWGKKEENTKHVDENVKNDKQGSSCMKGRPGLDGTIAWWYTGRRGIILLIVPRALSPSAVVIPGVLLVLPGLHVNLSTGGGKKRLLAGCISTSTRASS